MIETPLYMIIFNSHYSTSEDWSLQGAEQPHLCWI